MSEKPKRPDPEALKATFPGGPRPASVRHVGAPTAPPRRKREEKVPALSGPALHVPDYLDKTEEVMEIQAQADAFKARTRAPEKVPDRSRSDAGAGRERILAWGASLQTLARLSGMCAMACLGVAIVIFCWPLFNAVIAGKTTPQAGISSGAKGKGGIRVYTPGNSNTARGQQPGGRWSQGEGGAAMGGDEAGAGGSSEEGSGFRGLISRIPLGPLGPERSLAFMIFSTPDKAEVILDGQPRGNTPVGANLDCRENERVGLELRKPGYMSWEKVFRCKEGNIKVHAILKAE